MIEVCQYVKLAQEHNWPLTGGVLDQTKSFIDAYNFMQADENRVKNELGI